PDFIAQTLSGETITLADYAGRNVGLLYISPHCDPCKEKLPAFQALYTRSQQIGLDWLLVSLADTLDETQAMLADFKISMPVLSAPRESNSLAQDYMANATPSYCLVGVDGKVVLSGYPDTETNSPLQKKLEEWGIGKGGDV
ncbi:MAG: peroxiredoxin family protein, partial [Anaerolineales bacterium]